MLLTSLSDPEKYPADEIVDPYHERWEIELGYDEIKTHLLEREEAIRSRRLPVSPRSSGALRWPTTLSASRWSGLPMKPTSNPAESASSMRWPSSGLLG